MTEESIDKNIITPRHVEKALDYNDYKKLTEELLSKGKTSGNDHSDVMIQYTMLNIERMKRLDKSIDIVPEVKKAIKKMKTKWLWLVLTEAWCDDSAQCIPVMAKIAKSTTKIEMRLLFRDENPILMDNYLTDDSSRSIPKLICVDPDSLQEIWTWGPRPKPAQEKMKMYKSNRMVPYDEFIRDLRMWYAKDKTVTTQQEIARLIAANA